MDDRPSCRDEELRSAGMTIIPSGPLECGSSHPLCIPASRRRWLVLLTASSPTLCRRERSSKQADRTSPSVRTADSIRLSLAPFSLLSRVFLTPVVQNPVGARRDSAQGAMPIFFVLILVTTSQGHGVMSSESAVVLHPSRMMLSKRYVPLRCVCSTGSK